MKSFLKPLITCSISTGRFSLNQFYFFKFSGKQCNKYITGIKTVAKLKQP